MLQQGDGVVIGLSGGADSVALLHVLLALQARLGITQIYAVHVNHGLRGDAAVSDEKFVQNLCDTLQIQLKIYHADVRGLAHAEHLTIEEAGRKLRYFYFNEACAFLAGDGAKKIATGKIATGHHQNDNAETVILNLSRGAGLRGLCGIPPVNGNVVRPLLDVSRAEIEEYLADNKLEYITDASNLTHEYARNRVRHSVLPFMEEAGGKQAVQTIARNAALLRADEEYLESVAIQAFKECLDARHCENSLVGADGNPPEPSKMQSGGAIAIAPYAFRDNLGASSRPTAISLDVEKLACLHPAISSRVIRHAISQISGLSNITAAHIQAILDLAQKKTGKEVHIPGLVAYREYSCITITAHSTQYEINEYSLPLHTVLDIPELNQTISISTTPPDKSNPPNHKKPILYCTKSFDYGMVINGVICLRTRRPGDKIILGGAKPFTKKLQDYFTDTKIPRQKRDSIPIIACGNDVLWVMDERNTVNTKYYEEKNKNLCWISLWRDTNA